MPSAYEDAWARFASWRQRRHFIQAAGLCFIFAKRMLHFFDSEVFRNFVDAFRAFRVCRQIRTGEMHFLIFTLRCATHRQAICILKTLRFFEMVYSPLDMPKEQADFWKQQLVLLQKLSFYHIRCLCVPGVKTLA